jgi:uncharacterized protein
MAQAIFHPANLADVIIEDQFWAPRQRLNREVTIPVQYEHMKRTGRIDAFDLNWTPGEGQRRHWYYDSDVYKWVEALCYALALHMDDKLGPLLDEVVDLIAGAQLPDGYLNTHYTINEPDKRCTNLYDGHELYQAGHLIEAAVAYYESTGSKKLLDVACRFADYLDTIFGSEPGKKRGYCGHPEIELALMKLYRATGESKYLRLCQYFINERGRQPYYYDAEAVARGVDPVALRAQSDSYEFMQARIPIREQTQIAGHAVMAMYLYSAVTDLANETGDDELAEVSRRIWHNLVTKRMYVHGGIGSTKRNEGFTADYDLPNETAYAETCAQIGLVFWAHRMVQIDCDRQYSDIMERALYNGILSAYSQDGKRFFYENRLASAGDHHREEWHWCSCCPPNYARLIASLGKYIYSTSEKDIAVHLYVQGSGATEVNGIGVIIAQETDYPWDGKARILVKPEKQATFAIRLRIPGWARSATVRVNGEQIDMEKCMLNGYARIEREWSDGDIIELDLPMPVERVKAHPDIRQDFGRVALQRGPIVYCLEEADNPFPLNEVILPDNAGLTAVFDENLLGGVSVIQAEGLIVDDADWQNQLYRADPHTLRPCKLTAIPYFAWDNRAPGQMLVWIATA